MCKLFSHGMFSLHTVKVTFTVGYLTGMSSELATHEYGNPLCPSESSEGITSLNLCVPQFPQCLSESVVVTSTLKNYSCLQRN